MTVLPIEIQEAAEAARRITADPVPFDEQSAVFLDALWGDREGKVWITTTDRGQKGTWGEHRSEWPEQRAEILEFIAQRRELGDVYCTVCVLAPEATNRGKEHAQGSSWASADLDGVGVDPRWVERHHAMLVESGSPGGYHVWPKLDRWVDRDERVELCQGLVAALGADPAPVQGNAVLRVPGTWNWKHGRQRPVRLIVPPNGHPGIDPAQLLQAPAQPERKVDDRPHEFTDGQAERYLERALDELREAVQPGRNIKLNNAAMEFGHFVPHYFSADEATARLLEAADECGLLAEPPHGDGKAQCRQSIASGLRAGQRSWKAQRPDSEDDELTAETRRELLRIQARTEAQRLFEREQHPFVAASEDERRFVSGSVLSERRRNALANPPAYLVEGVLIEGSYGTLGAEYKAGKTWLMLDLLISIAAERPWLGQFRVPTRHRVAYMLGEGQEYEFYRRVNAVCVSKGIDPDRLFDEGWLSVQIGPSNLSDPRQLSRIYSDLLSFDPDVLGIDPWYLSAGTADGKNLAESGGVLRDLQGMARVLSSALVIAQHWNKTGQGNGTARWTGSGLQEWSRFMINVEVKTQTDAAPYADDPTGRTTAALALGLSGEISGRFEINREVWTGDVRDPASPMHYVTRCILSDQQPTGGDSDSEKILAAVAAAGVDGIGKTTALALACGATGGSTFTRFGRKWNVLVEGKQLVLTGATTTGGNGRPVALWRVAAGSPWARSDG